MKVAVSFSENQSVILTRDVQDDETGYRFPAGSPARFEEGMLNAFCLIAIDRSIGDELDSGETVVMVQLKDIRAG